MLNAETLHDFPAHPDPSACTDGFQGVAYVSGRLLQAALAQCERLQALPIFVRIVESHFWLPEGLCAFSALVPAIALHMGTKLLLMVELTTLYFF